MFSHFPVVQQTMVINTNIPMFVIYILFRITVNIVFYDIIICVMYTYMYITHYICAHMLYHTLYFLFALLLNVHYYPDILNCICLTQTLYYNYVYIVYIYLLYILCIHMLICYFYTIITYFRFVCCIKGSNRIVYILSKYDGPS